MSTRMPRLLQDMKLLGKSIHRVARDARITATEAWQRRPVRTSKVEA